MSSLVGIHILVSEFKKKSKCIYTISGVDYAGELCSRHVKDLMEQFI